MPSGASEDSGRDARVGVAIAEGSVPDNRAGCGLTSVAACIAAGVVAGLTARMAAAAAAGVAAGVTADAATCAVAFVATSMAAWDGSEARAGDSATGSCASAVSVLNSAAEIAYLQHRQAW